MIGYILEKINRILISEDGHSVLITPTEWESLFGEKLNSGGHYLQIFFKGFSGDMPCLMDFNPIQIDFNRISESQAMNLLKIKTHGKGTGA